MGNLSALKAQFNQPQSTNETGYNSRMEAAEDLLHKLLTNHTSDFKEVLAKVTKQWPGISGDVITTFFALGDGSPCAKESETTLLLTATLLGNIDTIESILDNDPLAAPHIKISLKDSPLSGMAPIELARKLKYHAILERMDAIMPRRPDARASNDSRWETLWRNLLHRHNG